MTRRTLTDDELDALVRTELRRVTADWHAPEITAAPASRPAGARNVRRWHWRRRVGRLRLGPLAAAVAVAVVVTAVAIPVGRSLHFGAHRGSSTSPSTHATPQANQTPAPSPTPFPSPGRAAFVPVQGNPLTPPSALGPFLPAGVTLDAAGTLYVAASELRVIRIATSGSTTMLATDAVFVGTGSNRDPNRSCGQLLPTAVRVDSQGNLYLGFLIGGVEKACRVVGGIARISPDGNVTYLTQAGVLTPNGLAIGPDGALYVSHGGIGLPGYSTDVRISRIDNGGKVVAWAGNGTSGSGGDGGPATRAQFMYPAGLAFDRAGNLYVADVHANRVRRISPTGIITTFAGTGVAGYSGDGGAARSAQLDTPSGVAVDQAGNVYIADSKNNRIRRVTPDGTISTVAGTGAALQQNNSLNTGNRVVPNLPLPGDGGPATSAPITGPTDLTFDAAGDLIIADTGDFHVRKVTPDGRITSIV